jgi:hypothetical protein
MNFEKLKVNVQMNTVSINYGDTRDDDMQKKIISSFNKTKACLDSVYGMAGIKEMSEMINKKKGFILVVENIFDQETSGKGFVNFVFTIKDIAKSALTKLKEDGFKFEDPLPTILETIDKECSKLDSKQKK